ncbi:MAG TPA: Gfo/Idh/MocA family oxidoreductase [Armatimonadota bacterium]
MGRQGVRLGLIGTGLMGREIAAAILRWCSILEGPPQPRIVAVCGRDLGRRRWFEEALPGIQSTPDYRELLANPDVDAVYCAVPHDLHQRFYVDTMGSGKHLLGEKPFGIDQAANSAILEEVARHPELVVRCASQLAFYPGAQRVLRLARDNAFGRILEAEVTFRHSSDLDPLKPINWKRRAETNGEYGCMGDLGMHILFLPLRMGWAVRNVRAILSKVVDQRPDGQGGMAPCDTWDNATLLCEAEAGGSLFPLTVKTQRIAPGEMNTWSISVLGTETSARFSTKYPRTLETLRYRRGEPQAWLHEDLGYASVYPSIAGAIFEFGFSDAILQMLAAFFDEVPRGPGGEVPFGCVTPEETRVEHSLFTAALDSQRGSRVVSL